MFVADNFRLQKQADSCRSLTTEARVRSQPSTCEISGGPSGSVTEFFSQYFGFPLSAPFQHCSVLLFYLNTTLVRKTSGRIPGIFKQRWRRFRRCFQPPELRVLRFCGQGFYCVKAQQKQLSLHMEHAVGNGTATSVYLFTLTSCKQKRRSLSIC